MARRGTPLAFAVRQEIKRLREIGMHVRDVASKLGINKETVCRYAPTRSKFRTGD